jgi:hypothetical protein
MYYGKFDSYYYSRPVSYRSYNPRLLRSDVIAVNDTETNELLDFFRRNNIEVENFGGLGRGVRFGDLLVERRQYNHNSSAYYATTDYVIRQWKPTNDLNKYHPTGSHIVVKSFSELLAKLQGIVHEQAPKK